MKKVVLSVLFLTSVVLLFSATASWNYNTQTGNIGTTYNWIDASGGTELTMGDDASDNVQWPFDFQIYDDNYTGGTDNISVCSNGYMRFDGDANTNWNTAKNYDLTSDATSLGQIICVGIYDDNVGDSNSHVYWNVTGTAPNRILTIEYQDLEINYSANHYADIEVQFYESENKIVMLFGDDDVTQTSADQGIHSGVSGYFYKWGDVDSNTNQTWLELTKPAVVGPGAPTNPDPADGATDVAVNNDPDISWTNPTGTVYNEVYFGTDQTLVQNMDASVKVLGDGTTIYTSYNQTSDLDYNTTYYWKVVEYNNAKAASEGPVWSFTTAFNGIQIGNGTTVNEHLPIEPYYGYTYSQTIYKASDFGTVGSNKQITKIYYNYHWYSSGDDDSDDWVIYMGTTSQSTLTDWIPNSSLTEVFNGDVNLENVGNNDGWLEIVLDSPFPYDPATDGNLVIAVDENTPSYTSGSDDFYCDQDTRADVSIYYYSDGTNPDPASPPEGHLSEYYPNIRFTFEDMPACPKPTYLTESNITWSSAVLDWTENGSATKWDIEWGPTGFTQGSGTLVTDITSKPYNLTGLSANTTYDWYVRANCSLNGLSEWNGPHTFTTLCEPNTTYPYIEDFSTWPPDCWDLTGGTASWEQYSDNGINCAKAHFWGQGTGTTDIMTTQYMDISSLTNPGLLFDWSHKYHANYPHDSLYVMVSGDFGSTWNTVWAKGDSLFDSNDGADDTVPGSFVSSGYINLSSFGDTIIIKFKGVSGWGPDLFIDNVTVKEIPAHDILVVSQSIGQAINAEAITPTATFRNNGVNTETFDVTFQIDSRWSSTKTITNLASLHDTTVTFDSWTPVANTKYDITVYSQLAADVNTSNDTISSQTIALNLDITAYAHDASGSNVVTFNLKDPTTFTTLASQSCTDFYSGMTFVDTLWKAFEYGGNGNRNIWTIDKTSGAQTRDTTYTAANLNAIAYNPSRSGTVYGASSDTLYTVDLATGECTPVGPFGITDCVMIGMAYDQQHNILYGIDLATDKLYTINTSTGQATEVGPLGIDINYAQDCAFDQEHGYLFLAGYTSTGSLYYIDTQTGAAAKVDDFYLGHEITGFAIPYTVNTINSPANVTINISGGNVNLSWDAVSGATSYTVYSATDPYGTFTAVATGITGTTWSEPVSGDKKFYQVTANTTLVLKNRENKIDVLPYRKPVSRFHNDIDNKKIDRK